MLRRIAVTTLAVTLLPLAACTDDGSAPLAPAPVAEALSHASAPPGEAAVVTFADPSGPAVGSSRIRRGAAGIEGSLLTELETGTAVTVWLVVFNEPSGCDGPCDEPDLFNPDAEVDIVYAAGRLVGDTRTRFRFARAVGDASGSIGPLLGLEPKGILDAYKAEIHYIVRTHGPVIPGLEAEMTSTFGGGCLDAPDGYGAPGPNACEDIQFAVHLP